VRKSCRRAYSQEQIALQELRIPLIAHAGTGASLLKQPMGAVCPPLHFMALGILLYENVER
jgi:hypothetical protein